MDGPPPEQRTTRGSQPIDAAHHASEHIRCGERLGRYRVGARVGMGGGGVVYAGYDEALDRPVAIKVLWSQGHDPVALAREAQLVAELTHPNIVAIYDVGVARGRSFVVMEWVEGGSMRSWLSRVHPRRARIVAMLTDAARGLAHAHRMGIVHRDFKLDNILVGEGEQPLVTDFGLATRLGTSGDHPGAGTLPSMAPEQHRGEPAGPASDQFSLSVALFHALHRVLPFAGDCAPTLLAAKESGAVRAVSWAGIPRHVKRAIVRGLSARPADRFASIEEFIAAIERRGQLRWAGGIAGVAVVAATGLWMATMDDDPCHERRSPWSVQDVVLVRGALGTSATDPGNPTEQRVARMLSDYAGEWTRSRARLCESSESPVRQPALEAIDGCLRRARLRLVALTTVFAQAEPSAAEHAVKATESLLPPGECWRHPEPSADQPPLVRVELESTLALAEAYEVAGRFLASEEVARRAATSAQTAGLPTFEARARLIEGRAALQRAHHAEGQRALENAYYGAVGVDDDDTALDAAVRLLLLSLHEQPDAHDARRWERIAQVHVQRASPSSETRAHVLHVQAEYAFEMGRPRLALERHRQALALRRRSGRPSLSLAESLEGLGRVEFHLDDQDHALERFEEALQLRELLLGEHHPWLAVAHNNYGIALAVADEQERAQDHLESGLRILESTLGREHPRVGRASSNLGRFLLVRGESAAARVHLERAASIFSAVHAPVHRDSLVVRKLLAIALRREGEPQASLDVMRRVVADAERSEGALLERTTLYQELASSYRALGRHEEALEADYTALSLIDTGDAAEAMRPHIELGIASTLEKLGRYDAARLVAEQAWGRVGPGSLKSWLALMRARLEQRRGHHDTALELALAAREQLPQWAQADRARVRRIETLIDQLRAESAMPSATGTPPHAHRATPPPARRASPRRR